jgi:hypothetical protein
MLRTVFLVLVALVVGCSPSKFDGYDFSDAGDGGAELEHDPAKVASGGKKPGDSKREKDAGAELEQDAGAELEQDAGAELGHQVDAGGAELEHDAGGSSIPSSSPFAGAWTVTRKWKGYTATCYAGQTLTLTSSWLVHVDGAAVRVDVDGAAAALVGAIDAGKLELTGNGSSVVVSVVGGQLLGAENFSAGMQCTAGQRTIQGVRP